MDEPLDRTEGWTDLTLPDAAEVSHVRMTHALRYAMQFAGRARRGGDVPAAVLSSVAHLVDGGAGLLAKTDAATLVTILDAAARAGGMPPSAVQGTTEISDPASADPFSVAGWHVLAARPDASIQVQSSDASSAAPIAVELEPTLDMLGRSLLIRTPAGFEATTDGDRILRRRDLVLSLIRRDHTSAHHLGHHGPRSATLAPPLAQGEADHDAAEELAIDESYSSHGDDEIEGPASRGSTGDESTIDAVSSSARLAVDSAALRDAVLASSGNAPPGKSQSIDSQSGTADQKSPASGNPPHVPDAAWSLLILTGLGTDPALPALMHAFHRAAIETGILADAKPDLLASLSRGERETVQLLLTGKSETAIAHLLRRSPHTVHSHVKRAYRKLGVGSRAELMAKLLQR